MKSFLIIGLSTFGRHLCRELASQKCEVMVVDNDPVVIDSILPYASSAKVGNCTDEEVLKTFDVPSFDACFVCVGSDFQASLEIISLLSEMGAKKVYGKAENDVQAKFFLRNGADGVIFPERDEAKRVAFSQSSETIFDCIPLTEEYSIFEIAPLDKWKGRSIIDLDFRRKYNMSILAIKKENNVFPMPPADYVFTGTEHIIVLGVAEDVKKLKK